jgi:hypothetical protein
MIQQMSPREKTLAMVVAAMAVLIISFGLFRYLTKWHSQLRSQLTGKTSELAEMQALMSERDMWVQRDEFMKSKQPALTNSVAVGATLMEETKAVADKHGVIIKEQSFSPAADSKSTLYKPVTINLKTSSTKDELIDFCYNLQAPDRFLVFEKANFKIDESDKSKMAGTFTLSKWFVPPPPR